MKYTLHDLIQARGVSEPLREAVVALMARLEAAEKERDALRDRIEVTDEVVRELEKKLSTGMWRALREENEALQAKITGMERQEPVKYECRRKPRNDVTWGLWKQCFKSDTARWGSKTSYEDKHFSYEVRALYALPGAKGEEK